jgi:hypothetical protein
MNPSDVTFGDPVTAWTAGPGNRTFQLNVFWPTDPTINPANPAKGDGVNDDSAAIQAAIDLAVGAGGGIVMLPAGTFKCISKMPTLNGNGIHLLGAGKDATIILQGATSVAGTNPAVIEVTAKRNSIQHLSIQGITNMNPMNPGPINSPINPLDPALGAGWAILCAGSEGTFIADVRITGTYHGIGAIGFNGVRMLETEAVNCVGTYGYYAQGPQGQKGRTTLTLSGNPVAGNTITVTLVDDQGDSFTTTYTLVAGDAGNLTNTATHLANAINQSGAVTGQFAFLQTVTSSGAVLTFTAKQDGVQGNLYTILASATGAVGVAPNVLTNFTGGMGSNSNDFNVLRGSCSGTGSSPQEAFHCDGGVASFNLNVVGTTGCGFHTRVANDNGGTAHDPNDIHINAASSDHSFNKGYSFEKGSGCRLLGSSVVSTLGGNPAIDVGPNFGGEVKILVSVRSGPS